MRARSLYKKSNHAAELSHAISTLSSFTSDRSFAISILESATPLFVERRTFKIGGNVGHLPASHRGARFELSPMKSNTWSRVSLGLIHHAPTVIFP